MARKKKKTFEAVGLYLGIIALIIIASGNILQFIEYNFGFPPQTAAWFITGCVILMVWKFEKAVEKLAGRL